jgi:pimeloyl-ACP methyl ester carboxylesterase
MSAFRHLGELRSFAAAALAAPLGRYLCGDTIEAEGAAGPPVVLVHGLLGNRLHFRSLRKALARRGIGRFATFTYRPRIDHHGLAEELGAFIERVCDATGEARVDVVGHSLGGLVSRYLLESGGGARIRCLVTLGSPYYGCRFPGRELAIFAADDALIALPREFDARRCVVVADCGHMGLLDCPEVHERIADHLSARSGPRAISPVPRGERSSAVKLGARAGSVRPDRRRASGAATAKNAKRNARGAENRAS